MLSMQPSRPVQVHQKYLDDGQDDVTHASARARNGSWIRSSRHGQCGREARLLRTSTLQSEEEHYGNCLGPDAIRHCALMRNHALPFLLPRFLRLHLPYSESGDNVRFFRSFLLFWSTIDLVQYRNRGFSIRSRPPPPPLEPPTKRQVNTTSNRGCPKTSRAH